jgi:ribosomal protein S16
MMRLKRVDSAKSSGTLQKMRPALTPEARQNQMISLAMDRVEQRLRDGTATSQETTHFLKLATQEAKLKVEILEKEKELVTAKTEAIRSQAKIEELYSEAINALRRYGGHANDAEE